MNPNCVQCSMSHHRFGLLLCVAASAGNQLPLRVCTTSICGRNGGQPFAEALATLSEGTDLQVIRSGCMSVCNGIVVAGGPVASRKSLKLKLESDDQMSVLSAAVMFLEEHGLSVAGGASYPTALIAAANGADDTAKLVGGKLVGGVWRPLGKL